MKSLPPDEPSSSHDAAKSSPELEHSLSADLAKALGKSGLLVPETLAEVKAAESEQAQHNLSLPRGLQQFTPRPAARAPHNVVPIESGRARGASAWLPSALGFVLGAAAASVVWQQSATEQPEPEPRVGGVASELRTPLTPPEPLRIRLAGCSDCCAGSQCSAAKEETRTCPSGRSCVACSPGDSPSAYKIRVSALALSDVGKEWLKGQNTALDQMQLCATIQGRAIGCRSAVEAPGDLLEWVSLPVATLASQLVGGVAITLQAPDASVLATWSSSIAVSSEILCRGVAARLTQEGSEPLGRVSLFFDDAQFVELTRAASVAELVAEQGRISVEGAGLSIYETSAAGAGHFALVLGPTDRARAETVRWQLLDQKLEAKLTFGEDHKGRPRPQ